MFRYKVNLLILLIVLMSLTNSNGTCGIEEINNDSKDLETGKIASTIEGKCGQDYKLVTPTNADIWLVNITVQSEWQNQSIQIRIYEAIGEYPYNYETQTELPKSSGTGEATLITFLNTSKNYEIWIRDGYARAFTGVIEEEWYPYILNGGARGTSESFGASPIIDGYIEENEWSSFQEILIPYWKTFKEGTIYGAEPWDTEDKICHYSIQSKDGHLYFCLKIPDNYLSENYTRAILSIYLDDHTQQDFYDRKTMIWGSRYDIGEYQENDYVSDGIHYRENGDDYDTGPGGSLDIISEYSHTGEGTMGADGIYVFEFDFPLKTITGDPRDADVGDLDISISYSEWENGWNQSSYWKIDPRYDEFISYKMIPELLVDQIIAPTHVDVGSSQIIQYHLKWNNNNTDASGVSVIINDNVVLSNSSGWAKIVVSENEIGVKTYALDEVVGIKDVTFKKTMPEIIWDSIEIIVPNLQRIDVDSSFEWIGKYAFNDEVFEGTLILNEPDTELVQSHEAFLWSYHIEGVHDTKYGIVTVVADDFDVIYDKVILELSMENSRIDVSESPNVEYSGRYAYDSEIFNGQIVLALAVLESFTNESGEQLVVVESIVDDVHGLSVFDSNELVCIFDQVVIEDSGVSSTSVDVGESVTIWFKAHYEYDNVIFDDESGSLYANDISLEWSTQNNRWEKQVTLDEVGSETYSISKIEDSNFGLTSFTDENEPVTVEWKTSGILGFPVISVILGLLVTMFFVHQLKTHAG